MRLSPRSASARLALAVTASFLSAFALLGVGVHYAVSAMLTQDARELVRVDAAGLAELDRADGRAALLAELRERIDGQDDADAVYALAGPDGRWIVGDARLPPLRRGAAAAEPPSTAGPSRGRAGGTEPDAAGPNAAGPNGAGSSGARPSASRPSGARAGWIEFIEPGPEGEVRVIAQVQDLSDGASLLTGTRTRSQDRFLALMLRTALAALLVAASLGALIGWLTSRWVSRRLRHLDDTAARVGAGELALRARLDGSDDAFDRLGRRFNGMLDRIEDLLGGVRHATDHIAHDLRTPLTRLRNRLEEARRREPGADAGARLDAAIAETDQLLQSFGALLRLARIEAQPPAHDEPVLDLLDLAGDAAELYTPIAAERGVALAVRLPQPGQARVRGDADQLFQMLVNLLDNAIKHAPPGTEVGIELCRERARVVVQIDDRGPGIPVADRERVFDRFQRLEAHRGSPGTGLGLSLVRAIAHRHGGQVALTDNGPGLRVRVSLAEAG